MTNAHLLSSPDLFRQLIESIDDVFYIADPHTRRMIYVNSAYERTWEQDRDTLYAQPVSFINRIHPEDRPRVLEGLERQKEGRPTRMEYRICFPSGRQKWVLDKCFPAAGGDGRPGKVFGMVTDITREKEIQQALKMREEEFRSSFEMAAVAKVQTDLKTGRFLRVNRKMCELTGYSREELLRMTFLDITHPDDKASDIQAVEDIQKEGLDYVREKRYVTKGGGIKWVQVSVALIHDHEGRPLRFHSVLFDISDRKDAQEALQVSEERFRQLADSMPQIVWTAGPDGKIDYFNRRWYEFTGFSPEEGVQDIFIIHPDDRKISAQRWEQSLKTGRPYEIEYRFYDRKISKYRWQLGRALPIRNGSGEIVRWFGTCTDIHEHKKNEQKLEELTQQLEKKVADRTRTLREQAEQLRLLASQLSATEQRERKKLAELIHDHLQQLLVASRIKVDFISRADMDEKVRNTLADVKQHLDEAVEASRSLTAQLRPPILYEDGLIAALEWLASEMKEKHNLTVDLELDEGAEPEKEEVKSMLYYCIRELLFNVVKYAEVSEAALSVKEKNHRIVICVSDKGRGFDLEEFYRNSYQRFGLFSTREYLKVIGGNMRINSERGKGTKVEIILPQRRKEKPKETGQPAVKKKRTPPRPRGRTEISVLIADDHNIVREGIATLLDEQPGITVVAQASDGEEAIAMADRYDPEVIIMDLNMPKMNGLEVTRLIKERSPHIRIIGLSVQEESSTAQAMKQAGAAAYFNKSDDYQKLIDTILSLSAV